jgi:hypothetical protein
MIIHTPHTHTHSQPCTCTLYVCTVKCNPSERPFREDVNRAAERACVPLRRLHRPLSTLYPWPTMRPREVYDKAGFGKFTTAMAARGLEFEEAVEGERGSGGSGGQRATPGLMDRAFWVLLWRRRVVQPQRAAHQCSVDSSAWRPSPTAAALGGRFAARRRELPAGGEVPDIPPRRRLGAEPGRPQGHPQVGSSADESAAVCCTLHAPNSGATCVHAATWAASGCSTLFIPLLHTHAGPTASRQETLMQGATQGTPSGARATGSP